MSVIARLRAALPWFLRRGRRCDHVGLIQEVTPSERWRYVDKIMLRE
ncbi:MAG: hypothetical protein GX579_10120 [Chloroflexi bacterium]|jgi:hypothetical protein|nr:hypothetical protein [Chloroflexota bacterium]